ncbi:LLM class F420-dependent oxidoreductase [Mycolicibacterium sp. CBMA 234]|uniref:LLM class F420-dependent oxidoreductase n=1 Tax=Mycolicibacterium sp. CBMA 234 TaxID=1918495 RepID=UPI001390CF58|nr:LLM class F420-dependent oxidoreductase [Mycolicibacterium sp. CBMA 234]
MVTDHSARVADIARDVESRGLDGLWIPDHTHIPASRETAYPLGGELPDRYRRNLETLTAMAMAASVTTRIRVGSGVLLAAQRDPIVTAKALATIDQQSGGRVAVGVGYGWNVDEMRDHGVDPATRRARTREHVLAMQQLWERETASYQGKFLTVAPAWSWPKPAQHPLPVLIGGAGTPKLFDHIAEYGSGWIPLGGRGLDTAIPRLRDRVAAAGRDPGLLEVVPFVAGTPDHGKVDVFERAGVTEVVFDISAEDPAVSQRTLDRVGEFVAERQRN